MKQSWIQTRQRTVNVRLFTDDYVSDVRPEAARWYLGSAGLPDEHVLFRAAEGTGPLDLRNGRRALVVGTAGADGVYAVEPETGAVLFVERPSSVVRHVNASPQAFVASLELFDSAVSEAGGVEGERLETAAATFREAISAIDPTAVADDDGFWWSVISDLASGGYSDDD